MNTSLDKIIIAIFPAGYFIWTGNMQAALATLVIFYLFDTLTGVGKAIYLKTLTSKLAGQMFTKKLANYGGMVLLGYMLSVGVGGIMTDAFIYVCLYYTLTEAYSIMENFRACGFNVPTKILVDVKTYLTNLKK